MMDLCSEAADHQSSRLDEFVLVSRRIRKAGWGAHASSPTVRKSSPTANGSFVLHRWSFAKLPPSLSTSSQRTRAARKDESRTPIRRFRLAPEINRNPRDQARRRKLPRPGAMATAHLEELLLNGCLRKSHLWTLRQRSGRTSPKAQTFCAPIRYLRKEFLPIPASQKFLLYLQAPEETWRTRRPLLPGRRKGTTSPPPGQKLRRKGTRNEKNRAFQRLPPSPPSLIVQPGSGIGAASLEGEAAQGPSPSPIDYSVEVEADFPKDLVSTMKENVAKKARRTVIGRTLGGRATLKTLFDCLKLHLPIPFVSITLLTRGYFEVRFEEEEGAKATR